VNSHELREGDVIFLRGSEPITIRRVWQQHEQVPVCNLTVQGLHTFAVGLLQVLVHNTSGTTTVADFSGELTRNTSNATRTLRNNLRTNSATHRPHHIIPLQTSDHPVVQAAARGGFNMNGANNGTNLAFRVHPQGSRHPRYNAAVRTLLDNLAARNLTDIQAAAEVQAISDRLRPGLDRLNQSGQPLR
jgi:hypothetical protein